MCFLCISYLNRIIFDHFSHTCAFCIISTSFFSDLCFSIGWSNYGMAVVWHVVVWRGSIAIGQRGDGQYGSMAHWGILACWHTSSCYFHFLLKSFNHLELLTWLSCHITSYLQGYALLLTLINLLGKRSQDLCKWTL